MTETIAPFLYTHDNKLITKRVPLYAIKQELKSLVTKVITDNVFIIRIIEIT